MNAVVDFIRAHDVLVVALLAVLEGLFCAILLRRIETTKARLRVAIAAAEDSARAAALAAPGGIDPEVVIQLLRSGRPTSLESVYQLMEQQAAIEEAERAQALAAITPSRTQPPSGPAPGAPQSPGAGGGAAADDVTKRLGRFG